MAMNKRTKAATESAGFLLIVAAVLVVLNFLGVFASARVDLTHNRLFSLSNGSLDVARRLHDKMTITAYFTENLPPPHNATEMYVRDMLREYEVASRGNIRVRFVNPDTDELREEATEAGLQRLQHPYAGNDTQQITEGFRGIVFEYLEEKRVLDNVTTEGLEYDITERIKEMAGDKVKIGILSGHGGPTLAQGLTKLREAMPTYELSEVSASQEIPQDIKALLIIGPETEISENELRYINQYVMRGGSLAVFGGAMKVDMQEGNAVPVNTGLNRLLNAWGVRMDSNIAADAQCKQIPMQVGAGFQMAVPFPPVPIIGVEEQVQQHAAVFHLAQMVLPFSSAIQRTNATGMSNARITTLAKTTENSWLLTGESISLRPRQPGEWRSTQTGGHGPYALAVGIEGTLPSAFAASAMSSGSDAAASNIQAPERSTRPVQVFVVGTAGFLRDELLPDAQRGGAGQIRAALAFPLNAIDWVAQDDDMIAIRAKSAEDPVLRVPENVTAAENDFRAAAEQQATAAQEQNREGFEAAGREGDRAIQRYKDAMAAWDGKKALYHWGNMLGVPLFIAIFGVIRWRMRKAKKANLKLA